MEPSHWAALTTFFKDYSSSCGDTFRKNFYDALSSTCDNLLRQKKTLAIGSKEWGRYDLNNKIILVTFALEAKLISIDKPKQPSGVPRSKVMRIIKQLFPPAVVPSLILCGSYRREL